MFEKMLEAMHLSEDDEEYDDEELDEEVGSPLFGKLTADKESDDDKRSSRQSSDRDKSAVRSSTKITPMRNNKTKGGNMEVCVIKPTSFEDAREICETLIAGRTIILNMEGLDLGVAQRIIDFICGACYALEGNFQRISPYMFVITPKNVELSGDLIGMIDGLDFAGIQTGF